MTTWYYNLNRFQTGTLPRFISISDWHPDWGGPWPSRSLRDPRKPVSGRKIATFEQIQNFVLSASKCEIVPQHHSLPVFHPSDPKPLTMQIYWKREVFSRSNIGQGWLLKVATSSFPDKVDPLVLFSQCVLATSRHQSQEIKYLDWQYKVAGHCSKNRTTKRTRTLV